MIFRADLLSWQHDIELELWAVFQHHYLGIHFELTLSGYRTDQDARVFRLSMPLAAKMLTKAVKAAHTPIKRRGEPTCHSLGGRKM